MDQVLDTAQMIRLKRAEILKIAAKHGVRNVRIFGSVARGEAQPDSDVDFLVDVGAVTSSWFPGGLIVDLEALLGKRVEVVTERGLHPLLRDSILREAVPVLINDELGRDTGESFCSEPDDARVVLKKGGLSRPPQGWRNDTSHQS